MIQKSKGVVLHHLKYGDSGVIVKFYTRQYGRLSVLIKGAGGKKKGKRTNLLQPLSVVDLEIYFREQRDLHTLKEFDPAYTPSSIYSDVRKISISIFLGEILNSILSEESPNEDLYDYLERSIVYFDKTERDYVNFHIAFLSGLTCYLGFEPAARSGNDQRYFDMMNGAFLPDRPSHGNYASPEISGILASFFSSSFEESCLIPLSGKMRNDVLETLVKYFQIHLPGLRNIKSLIVLKEVFS